MNAESPTPIGTQVAARAVHDDRLGLIDTEVLVPAGEVSYRATIKSYRTRFGHTDVLISPNGGCGTTWKQFDTLTPVS